MSDENGALAKQVIQCEITSNTIETMAPVSEARRFSTSPSEWSSKWSSRI
jgi:hypothetical protein